MEQYYVELCFETASYISTFPLAHLLSTLVRASYMVRELSHDKNNNIK